MNLSDSHNQSETNNPPSYRRSCFQSYCLEYARLYMRNSLYISVIAKSVAKVSVV